MPDRAPQFDPYPPPRWSPRGGVVRILIALIFVVIAFVIIVFAVRWLRNRSPLPVAPSPTSTSTAANVPATTAATTTEQTVASLIREPVTSLTVQPADVDGDGMDERVFVAIMKADGKGGVLSSAFDAEIGIAKFDLSHRTWNLVYERKIAAVAESDPTELLAATDLNGDATAEIIYSLHLAGSGSLRDWGVIAWRNGRFENIKPASTVYKNIGFGGHDAVTLAPNRLIKETFPLYGPNDPNCCASGGTARLFFRFTGTALKLDHAEQEK